MAAMNLIAKLLIVAEAYSDKAGINLRLLSDRIFSDRRRLEKLQAGEADLNTKSYEKAMLWFSANWPEAAEWPEGVERPDLPEPQDQPAQQQGAAA